MNIGTAQIRGALLWIFRAKKPFDISDRLKFNRSKVSAIYMQLKRQTLQLITNLPMISWLLMYLGR